MCLQGLGKRSLSFIGKSKQGQKKLGVRKRDDQKWHDGIVDQKMFYPEARLFSGGVVCWLKLGGWMGKAKFRDLEEGEKLNQSLVNKHFALTDQWGQAVHLSVYKAKNWNLESVASLEIGKQGGTYEFYLSYKGGCFLCSKLGSRTQNGGIGFLNLRSLPGSQGWVKFNTMRPRLFHC